MEKIAETQYAVHPLIAGRWSPRAFDGKAISDDSFYALFEAASWAPSAMNEQPWRYIAARKENAAGFEKLLNCLLPGNAAWAKGAAALVLVYTKLTYTRNGNANVNAFYDAGSANQNLLLQAFSEGIYSHVMEGFDKNKAREVFEIGDDFAPVCMIALGYPGQADQLDEPLRTRETAPRSRKPLTDFLKHA